MKDNIWKLIFNILKNSMTFKIVNHFYLKEYKLKNLNNNYNWKLE